MNKIEMKEALQQNICNVTFTKVTGESRTMKCTLVVKEIPQAAPSARTKTVIEEDVLAVYDVDKAGWRSFKPSKVTSFEISK